MAKLWLDLGNTRLKYWLIDDVGQCLAFDAKQHLQAPAELLWGLSSKLTQLAPSFIGVSSVLGDNINDKVAKILADIAPFAFASVGKHPLLSTRYGSTLGVDRWLQMLGAVDARRRLCVVGCGTALTIDLLDHSEHLGGYILPNTYLARRSLGFGTKQIDVQNGAFDTLDLGLNTTDAVNHGVLLSVVGAINEICRRYNDFALILTGGEAHTLAPLLAKEAHIDDDLLLTGLSRYFG